MITLKNNVKLKLSVQENESSQIRQDLVCDLRELIYIFVYIRW